MDTPEKNIPPMGKTPRKATPAQAEAARKNGAKSQGPHDTTQTRFNGMKHGMCATMDVTVDGEDKDLVDQKAAAYIAEFGAQTQAECDVLRTAAAAAVRTERCLKADKAATERDVAAVGNAADIREKKDIETLIEELRNHPRTAVYELRRFSGGLLYLLEQVGLIDAHLEKDPQLWPTQRLLIIYLLGRRPSDLFVDPVVMEWNLYYLAGLHGRALTAELAAYLLAGDKPADMMESEFRLRLEQVLAGRERRDQQWGQTLLRELLGRAQADLTERLEMVEIREQRDLLLAEKAADVSVTKECMLRQRYFRENSNSYFAALRQYRLMYELRMKYPGMGEAAPETGPEGGQEGDYRSEPGAPQAEGGQEGGTTSAAVQPSGEAAAAASAASAAGAAPVSGDSSAATGSEDPGWTVGKEE